MVLSVPRGFAVRDLSAPGGPEDRTVFGAFTVPDAVLAVPLTPLSAGLRCFALPPRAFAGASPAALDAAPTAVTWNGYQHATEAGSGATLHLVNVSLAQSVTRPEPGVIRPARNALALLAGTSLATFATFSQSDGGYPPEWFPGLWTREPRCVLGAGTQGFRVYCDANGAVHSLPQYEAAAPFVVDPAPGAPTSPALRALRTEYRGPVGGGAGLTRVLRPSFTVGGVSFDGLPEFVAQPGGAAGLGWRLLGQLLDDAAHELVPSGLYLVENVIDHAATRHPTAGALLSLFYFDRSNPPGPAFYEVSSPLAGWRAGNIEATGRRTVT